MRTLTLSLPKTVEKLSHGEFTFFVKEPIQQLRYEFTTPGPLWLHLFFEKEGQPLGQLLVTHKQRTGEITFGIEPQLTSATATVTASLKGNWVVKYFVSEQREATSFSVTITEASEVIETFEAGTFLTAPLPPTKTARWYKGDFHTHTQYSDGAMTPSENMRVAHQQGLDFFFATDHNIVANQWPHSETMVVFAGTELTTPFGHGNFLGIQQPILTAAEMPLLMEETGITTIIDKNRQNGIFSVNHPHLTPWAWLAPLPLRQIQALELINDPTFADNLLANQQTFQTWSKLWNHGWRITGLGGSDSHLLPHEKYEGASLPSLIGDPGTYVYSDSLHLADLLKAVVAGHTQVSRIGKLQLTDHQEGTVIPGSQMSRRDHHFTLAVADPTLLPAKFQVEWIFDGRIIAIDKALPSQIRLDHVLEGYHWLRGDLRDPQTGEYLATFTPIYWGEPTVTKNTWQEVVGDETD